MNQTKPSQGIKPTDKPFGKVVRFWMAQLIFELTRFVVTTPFLPLSRTFASVHLLGKTGRMGSLCSDCSKSNTMVLGER